MSTALSYPGLRCVLEFLDPMKRIHIASRNHLLRIIDKKIPIRLEDLKIETFLNLNDFRIVNYIDNKLWFKNGHGKHYKRIWPSNLNLEEATKNLFNSYLAVRSICVNRLIRFGMISQKLPSNCIVRINELECWFSNVEGLLINVDPSSFPLKKLRTVIREPDHLNHPVLTSAQELIVSLGFDGLTQVINQNNTNKSVTFENSSSRSAEVVSLVRSWKDNGREIGTKFKFLNYNSLLNSLLEEFKEFENERFNHTVNCPRLIIPINTTAEIQVILDDKNYIVVEVVSITLKKETNAT